MALFSPAVNCTFCGAAPVHHRLHYIASSIDILSSRLSPFTLKKGSWVTAIQGSRVIRAIAHFLVSLFGILGIIRFSSDPELVKSARSKSVWREAHKLNIRIEQLVVFGVRGEEMRALLPSTKDGKNLRWSYFESIPVPPWLQENPGDWIDDKNLFKKEFEKAGLPIARGRFVTTAEQALRAFREFQTPVITKPRSGSRARHTTVNIQTEKQLLEGFRRARELCPYVMVEECISGNLYRATCVNRKLVGIIQFIKPEVIADGVQTVDELLTRHNANKKFPNLTDVKKDEWYFDAIAHQGYTPQSMPTLGTRVLLSEHSERPNGGYFIDVTDAVPKETIAEIERGAEVCDIEVIGFDIISHNLTDPKERFTFIEGNTLPYIELHDVPYAGTPRNVARAVWDMWQLENRNREEDKA